MAESTKFVPKFTKKAPIHVKDEFFVKEKDIVLVKQFQEKIENMHHIVLNFEKKTEDGQWLILEGESEDRRNAKNYITAMCSPVERKQVQFPSSALTELTDPDTLEMVEKKTNAFIRPLKKIAHFEISGSEFAVILALSELEELAGAVLREGEQFEDEEMGNQEEDVITISPHTQNSTSRLSNMLERALSANSDGICSVDDYRHATPAVQRVLVNCLHADDHDDIDDDLLFADGPDKTKMGSSNLIILNEEDSSSDMSKTKAGDSDNTPVDKLHDSNSQTMLMTKQQEYLRSFGLSVGFQEAEVNKALQFVDDKTRPSDFLDLLNSLPKQEEDLELPSDQHAHDDDSGDDVVILETKTLDLMGDKKIDIIDSASDDDVVITSTHIINLTDDISDTKTPGGTKASQNGGGGLNKLPDEYKERLFSDFFSEDENCSKEELKRRNEERQKMLRELFEKNQNAAQQGNASGQPGKNSRKNKAKKKKKNKQQNQTSGNQTSMKDVENKQLGMNTESNSEQTYSQDDEQTCVLRPWINEEDEKGSRGNKQDGEFIQTTPKRNQKWQPTWQQQQQISCNNSPRQNSPGRQAAGQWSQFQQQGACARPNRKPTQVVVPVNVPNRGYGNAIPQSVTNQSNQAELRYIVIDGSNVAMTHGNGKFSCKGIKICVDYFRQRGHNKITVFVPQWRQCRPSDDNPILDQDILSELKNEEILVFTPSRRIGRKLVAAYDDRFVLELAEAEDGIVVSNDQYRDLMTEKTAWRKLIEERLLMYSFVRDRFMPPNDPLGRDGPCLDTFLTVTKPQPVNSKQHNAYQNHQHQQQQPYYYPQALGHGHFQQGQGQIQQGQGHLYQGQGHGSQGNFKQGQVYVQQSQGQFQQGQGHFQQGQGHFQQGHGSFSKAVSQGLPNPDDKFQNQNYVHGAKHKTHGQRPYDLHQTDEVDSVLLARNQGKGQRRGQMKGQGLGKGSVYGLARTDEETEELFKALRIIFPEDDQEEKVRDILSNHDRERDLTKLTNYLMSVLF